MMQLMLQYGCIKAHSSVIEAIQLNCDAYESQSTIWQPMKDNDLDHTIQICISILHDIAVGVEGVQISINIEHEREKLRDSMGERERERERENQCMHVCITKMGEGRSQREGSERRKGS